MRARSLLLAALATTACAGRAPGDVRVPETDGEAAVVAVDCDEVAPVATVVVHGDGFSPDELVVRTGDVVRFENADPTAHTTTSWEIRRGVPGEQTPHWDEPLPGGGTERCLRFDDVGEHAFLCALHPEEEQGVIQVRAEGPEDGDDGDVGTADPVLVDEVEIPRGRQL